MCKSVTVRLALGSHKLQKGSSAHTWIALEGADSARGCSLLNLHFLFWMEAKLGTKYRYIKGTFTLVALVEGKSKRYKYEWRIVRTKAAKTDEGTIHLKWDCTFKYQRTMTTKWYPLAACSTVWQERGFVHRSVHRSHLYTPALSIITSYNILQKWGKILTQIKRSITVSSYFSFVPFKRRK